MTGRIVLATSEESLLQLFGTSGQLPGLHPMPPRYNIAPTQPVLTIIKERAGNLVCLMRWGFLPEWVKDPKDYSLINSARSETVEEKPSFRNAIRRRRCLIPATGFYEWGVGYGNGEAHDDIKQPYYVTKSDGTSMALAGIWETWMGPYGEEVDTTAILTKKASGALAKIGSRTPVLIEQQDFDLWLDTSSDLMTDARPLFRLNWMEALKVYPVSNKVNNAGNDDATLIEPSEMTELEVATFSAPHELDASADQDAGTPTQLTLL